MELIRILFYFILCVLLLLLMRARHCFRTCYLLLVLILPILIISLQLTVLFPKQVLYFLLIQVLALRANITSGYITGHYKQIRRVFMRNIKLMKLQLPTDSIIRFKM